MAAPLRADIKYYRGANAAPTNDSDPLGGAIYTSSELNPASPSNLWSTLAIGASPKTVYSVHYRKNEATGDLMNARFYNRAGAKVNTLSGVASIASNYSGEDVDVLVLGKVSGEWDTDTISVSGLTVGIGTKTFDANSVIRWVVLSGTPVGLLGCSVGGETVGVIYGTSDDPSDGDSESLACYMISAETTWALATSKDTDLSSSNRLTAPTGIGSFEPATVWDGADDAIALPGDELLAGEYVGIVGKLYLAADIPSPPRDFQVLVVPLGDAQA